MICPKFEILEGSAPPPKRVRPPPPETFCQRRPCLFPKYRTMASEITPAWYETSARKPETEMCTIIRLGTSQKEDIPGMSFRDPFSLRPSG